MRSSDFFEDLPDSDDPWLTTQVLNDQLVDALRQGPIEQAGDLDAAIGMLDLVQDDLEAFGTGGGERLQNAQMVLALRTLETVCRRLGITLELPFRDFGTFRSYWIRQGASGGGGWQARRDLIEDLLGPTRQRLRKLEEQPLKAQLNAEAIASLRDPAAIQEQLGRIQRAVVDDPALAIGSAKQEHATNVGQPSLGRLLGVAPADQVARVPCPPWQRLLRVDVRLGERRGGW